MNGSGCKNCPVNPCETTNYRGSTCAAQRAKLGLGDPQTNADRIRAMSDEELAEWLGEHLDCSNCPVGVTCVHGNGCPGSLVDWLKQPTE